MCVDLDSSEHVDTENLNLSPFAFQRITKVLLATYQEQSKEPKAKRIRYHPWIPALAGAAVVTVIAIIFSIIWPGKPSNDRIALSSQTSLIDIEYAVKGFIQGEPGTGIRLFKVVAKGTRVKESSALMLDDIITFSYTRVAKGIGYLALIGLQQDGRLLWYYPDYSEVQSTAIKGDNVDEPLHDGIDLSVNHRPGWLRIVALFSEHPLTKQLIEQRLAQLTEKQTNIKEKTPLFDAELGQSIDEHSLLLEISPTNKNKE